MTKEIRVHLVGTLGIAWLVSGCSPAPTPAVKTDTVPARAAKDDHEHPHKGDKGHAHPHKSEGDHGHGAGPHDGTLADWGGGKFHVEFTVDHEKKEATVYVLGDDEKTATPVKADKLLLSITDPKFQTELLPVPLEGETDGRSSRFVGRHENLGIVKEFAGTLSAEVDGTPYAGDFKEEPHGEHDHK